MPSASEQVIDALVVGAGFSGIYELKKLRDLGLHVKLIDTAGDVGGTWWWNRYPGAMSDTESYLYRFSWDTEDLQEYPWHRHYVYQPEVLAYLQHVTDRHDLRKHMSFNTAMEEATWDESASAWFVRTSTGLTYRTTYLITALGLLSQTNFPNISGIEHFTGEKYHTGSYPENVSLKGKRVGVIGNGSTGVQVITEIAKDVAHLTSFQRNPQYSVPSGQGPISPEYRQQINSNYDQIWHEAKHSLFAFGFQEASRGTFSVPEEERQAAYERAWKRGGGFAFMFSEFGDVTLDEAANHSAADFIKRKIRQTVTDPEKARKLMPTQLYARRPLCDAGYYEQFNRENVEIVSLKETPITRFTPSGIQTSDGITRELDVVIFATGFDAVDGNYVRTAIKGRNGETLKDHWKETGPTSYLGVAVASFPNLFLVLGPNGPFCNIPPGIETQVELIADIIGEGRGRDGKGKGRTIEVAVEAEKGWTDLCDEMSKGSLFRKTDSWIFGSNVPGKKHAVMFYFGGLGPYRKEVRERREDGWRGFVFS